ncbi:MAG: LPS export ABC transporter periplasmic protein LptC [Longimicrobiales bacterium]|nr:LPS export ABC transporter periplasmic protein LptC [Longimicrobiales bacterium]
MKTCLRITALLAATGVAAACSGDLNTPVADEELQSMEADYVAFGMVSFITANGVREGRVEADTAYVFEDTGLANLHQMNIVFYEEETGREQATVTGLRGEWNRETNRMVARGDVLLFLNSDSSTIESEEIYYDPALGRVWSDSATVRTAKDGTVTSGSAFESDMSFENIRIENARGGIRRVF